MTIALIAAVARNGAIGCRGRLPWSLPEDLAHFKALTMGHPIVMGRRTFLSLPHGALPGRRNIVVSRSTDRLPGCEVYPSLESALEACGRPTCAGMGSASDAGTGVGTGAAQDDTVFVIGGASIYRQTIGLASVMHITLVDCMPQGADAFFPEIDPGRWRETKKEKHSGFSFITYTSL